MERINLNNFDIVCHWKNSLDKKEKAIIAVYFEVGAYNNDGKEKGMAHFIEHMLVMGLNDYPIYSNNNIIVSATTDIFMTIYYIQCENTKMEISKALKIAELLASGKTLKPFYMDLVREDVRTEYELYKLKIESSISYMLFKQFALSIDLPIGDLRAIESIRYKDLLNYFNKYYLTCPKKIVIVGKYENKERKNKLLKKSIYRNDEEMVWINLGFKKYVIKDLKYLYLAWGNLLQIEHSVEKIEIIQIALQIVIHKYYSSVISSVEIYSYGKRSLFFLMKIKREKMLCDESGLIKDVARSINEKIFNLAKKKYFWERKRQSRKIIGEMEDLLFRVENGMEINNKKIVINILKNYNYDKFSFNVKQIFDI